MSHTSRLSRAQQIKTLLCGDYKFIKFVNIHYKNKDYSMPLLQSDKFVDSEIENSHVPNAMICSCPFKYLFLKNSNTFGIFVNRFFIEQLTEREQVAVVLHEFGHFASGHLDFSKRNNSDDVEHEVEADAFVCDYGYGNELITTLRKTLNDGERCDEVDYRIRKIREKLGIAA